MKYAVIGALLLLLLAVSTVSAVSMGNFCNAVEMSSSFSGKDVSMTTIAGDRFVGSSVLEPVTKTYSADITGTGRATSYMRGTTRGESSSISFFQKTSASGRILKFSIKYQWNSGTS